MRKYTIISGTGRAGTTLLVKILTQLGFDTGFGNSGLPIDPVANAGLEHDIRTRPNCRIVKSPWIATYVEELLDDPDICIEHAIICIRDFHDAAQSRVTVQQKRGVPESVPGGLWMTTKPEDQERVLIELFSRLVYHLSRVEIPITFLHFPRFAFDADYLGRQLSGLFNSIDPERLRMVLHAEVRPELITRFAPAGPDRRHKDASGTSSVATMKI